MALYLGIDSGTQSTKAIILDIELQGIVAQAQYKYEIITGLAAGHLEQHPEDWSTAMRKCIEDCLNQIGERRQEIAGIGVSGQQHGLVVLDAQDRVIRPAKLWCDTSTLEQCDQIAHEFGGHPGCISLAGNAMLTGYTLPKLLWLKQNEPHHFAKIAKILLPHDYLNYWLTGVYRMEYGDASGTGAFDVRNRVWSRELCDFVDPHLIELLPEVGSSQAIHGYLRSELAQAWGLSSEVIVSAGGGDNMMGAIGTGNVQPGIITASFGTSGTLYSVCDTPIVDGQGEVAAFCDSTDQWLPLVCTMNVTVVSEQIRQLFQMSLEDLEQSLNNIPIGSDGLCFLPYLNGERTPNLPAGSGVIHGLNMQNMTAQHLLRAAVEGATLGLAYGLQRLRELGIDAKEIRLTGGGSKSPAWRQITSDIFNCDVVTLETSEGAALGGALQALYANQKVQGLQPCYRAICQRFVKLDESSRLSPRPQAVAQYTELAKRFQGLTSRLRTVGYL